MLTQLTRVLRGNRELSTFLICAALSFLCLFLPPSVKDVMSSVLSGTVLGPFKRISTAAVELVRIRTENEALRRLAVELLDERADLVEHKYENERLRELLDFLVVFPEEEQAEMLPARVVGMPGGRVIESIEIDAGSDDDVRPSMPVVVPGGLVGKVVRVFPHRSLVEPLSSASSGVSVVTERGRVRGVVKPRFGAGSKVVTWEVDYVQARSDVKVGDVVVTSGLGGVYPSGIVVGSVSSVVEQPLTMSIRVDLAVDLSTIEQVFVITGRSADRAGLDEMRDKLIRELTHSAEPAVPVPGEEDEP